jgi:hypothetical protein
MSERIGDDHRCSVSARPLTQGRDGCSCRRCLRLGIQVVG